EQAPLRHRNAQRARRLERRLGLHALDDRGASEVGAEGEDVAHDLLLRGVALETCPELFADLEKLRADDVDVLEMRVRAADIVEGEAHAQVLQHLDRAVGPAGERVLLGDLEDEAIEGNAGAAGVVEDALREGFVGERQRAGVDEEQSLAARQRSAFDDGAVDALSYSPTSASCGAERSKGLARNCPAPWRRASGGISATPAPLITTIFDSARCART